MTTKIKTIKIKAFRGITDLDLELGGKSLLLQGENGSGKSSVVDALEFFFTNSVSHLEGVRGLSLPKHGPNVNYGKDDAEVNLVFNPGTVSLRRTLQTMTTPPELLEEYFDATKRGSFILRRTQVLEFILSQPAERFKAVGSIIGLETLDELELNLMRAQEKFNTTVLSKKNKLKTLYENLSKSLNERIDSVEDVLEPLNRVLKEFKVPVLNSLEELDVTKQEIIKTARPKKFTKMRLIREIKDETKDPLIDFSLIGQIEKLQSKVSKLLKEESESKLATVGLLTVGKEIIQDQELEECPLCEQRIDRSDVVSRIGHRLKVLKALSTEVSDLRREASHLGVVLSEAQSNFEGIIQKVKLLGEMEKELKEAIHHVQLLADSINQLNAAKNLTGEINVKFLKNTITGINKTIETISDQVKSKSLELELTKEERSAMDALGFIEQVKTKLDEISASDNELNVAMKNLNCSKKIYSSFSESKKGKTQEIYDEIKKDVESYYAMLHPNEHHKNIELNIDLGKRASTDIKLESFGRIEDPRAFTSEGHLDSLGLCIFLAFSKKFNKGCSLIVLDDVVTTIDAGHRRKICELLFQKFGEEQLVITTHDGIWYQQLMDSQKAYGIEGKFMNLVIKKWELESGPIIRPYKPRWQKISDLIAEGEKELAGSEGRRYLEWVLDYICENFNVHVPYNKTGRYTVGELYPNAKKRLNGLLKEGKFKNNLITAFKVVQSTQVMGNLLAHDNVSIGTVSMNEVKEFCLGVNSLYEEFLCPSCGHPVTYKQELKLIECSFGKCDNRFIETTQ